MEYGIRLMEYGYLDHIKQVIEREINIINGILDI